MDSVILDYSKRFFAKQHLVDITAYLDPNLILFLEEGSRDSALDQLISSLDQAQKLKNKEKFRQAIIDRENLVSTGIGFGVAIPHAKLKGYVDFFIAVGIQKAEGLEWDSLDKQPVHLIFLIGGPDNKQTQYLKILSELTAAIRDEKRRKGLLKATCALEVMDLLPGKKED